MSVMWGLTGNMDQRLVSDGRALDVAYDAGEGKPKRIAEVIIEGKYIERVLYVQYVLQVLLM